MKNIATDKYGTKPMTLHYDEIVQRRRELKPLNGCKTLAEVNFDGPWVTPYQIASRNPTGPVLLGLHWLDEQSIRTHQTELRRLGYLQTMPFNKVLEIALSIRGLRRSDIYMTQVLHLLPQSRSYSPSPNECDHSFMQVTRYELVGRKVLALGSEATTACRRAGIAHLSACHPSARGRSYKNKAEEIAARLMLLVDEI